MERAGADLDIVGLQDDAALLRPIALQLEDEGLKARPARLEAHLAIRRRLNAAAGRPAWPQSRALGRNIGPACAAGDQVLDRAPGRAAGARGSAAALRRAAPAAEAPRLSDARDVPHSQNHDDDQDELGEGNRHRGVWKARRRIKASSVATGYSPKRAHNARASSQSSNSATGAAIAPASRAIAGRSRGSHQRRRR